MMSKKLFSFFLLSVLAVSFCLFPSCSRDEPEVIPEETVQWKELNDFSRSDLETLLKNKNLPDLSGLISGNTAGAVVKAVKISCKSAHPDGSDASVRLSGILLLPTSANTTGTYQEIIVPPFTYTLNADAPSVQYASDNLLYSLNEDLIYWTLVASSGYMVIIPDYPGFGDSYGECFIPYLEAKPLVRTTIDFTNGVNQIAQEKGYTAYKDVILCGYSQGAYVAASVARALETNASYGYSVDLLMIGGTPCNLKQIKNLAMASESFSPSYFLPYAIWGYKKNGYPNLNVSDLLLQPYAGSSFNYFDGKTDVDGLFPTKTSDLYTAVFRNNDTSNATVSYVDHILDDNSLHPWINKCDFIMTHGIDDRSVYYQNAKDYAEAHSAAGGTVKLISSTGDHSGAALSYYTQTLIQLILHKK